MLNNRYLTTYSNIYAIQTAHCIRYASVLSMFTSRLWPYKATLPYNDKWDWNTVSIVDLRRFLSCALFLPASYT